MRKHLFLWLQKVLPHHAFTILVGSVANIRQPFLKNLLIGHFIKIYKVNMDEAISSDLNDYASFNDFFIRQLKPNVRHIATAQDVIVSPADGTVAQVGLAEDNRLLQAKGFYFDLESLITDKELAKEFCCGPFATIYLAPHNYHRVHLPLKGKLIKSIYVPGKLFSVNQLTSESIPELYTRNERLITIFETEAGLMAVILVGAMIVGNIQMTWMLKPVRSKKISIESIKEYLIFDKGAEIGHFKMGSTVIVLFTKDRINWTTHMMPGNEIYVGQAIAKIRT